MRLHETSWDFIRLHETSTDFNRLARLQKTSEDFKRLARLHQTSCMKSPLFPPWLRLANWFVFHLPHSLTLKTSAILWCCVELNWIDLSISSDCYLFPLLKQKHFLYFKGTWNRNCAFVFSRLNIHRWQCTATDTSLFAFLFRTLKIRKENDKRYWCYLKKHAIFYCFLHNNIFLLQKTFLDKIKGTL